MDLNSRDAILARRRTGNLPWAGPALMLFARSGFAVAAQALVAAIYAHQSSPTPWHDAAAWLPVYGTLIDAGCLALLWWLARREEIDLFDLASFNRDFLLRDILICIALIPPSLVFIFGGVFASGWLVYGKLTPPYLYDALPLPAALYGTFVWPFVWGLTEQMTYNGYLLPRFQVLFERTAPAVAVVVFAWSFQHVVMPLTFDVRFMMFRLLSPIPFTVFITLFYLWLRRLLPLAMAHALMDGSGVFAGVLLPLLKP
jgi:membrane protease YdiL (CAAX protease family)